MTGLFLAIITLLTTRTKGNDRPVALVYCLISHVTYFCSFFLPVGAMFHFMAACEALLVAMLVCFRGCSMSRLTDLLIPVSLAAVFIDIYGWFLYKNKAPLQGFNEVLILYYALIIAIFIYAVVRYDRIHFRHSRFLRDNRNNNSFLGASP
ncbi:MAG: hypothetical protein ABW044_05435 [Cellvibrio sp.]